MTFEKRKRILFGMAAVFIFTACSFVSSFGGGGATEVSTPTLYVTPTQNLTLTAVFANATEHATNEPQASEIAAETSLAQTETPETIETLAPTTAPPAPAYAETPAAEVVTGVEAHKLGSVPLIDGDLTDWLGEMYAMTDVVYGSEYFANPADLSGQFKIAWDENHLYLGVVVFDTRYAQTATANQLYLGDSLEILLDTNLAVDSTTTELNGDDFQIGISAGNLNDFAIPEAYMWYPSDKVSPLPGVMIAGRLIENGYVVEVAMPWSVVGVSPTDAMRLGFLLSISDNDMQNMNAQQSVVSFSPLRELQNPTTWSELLLSDH